GSHRSWTKTVSRCTPSGCNRQTCTVPVAAAVFARSAAMPASSHASLTTVAATDQPTAIPPPTRLSSWPGSIAFLALPRPHALSRAAASKPHFDGAASAHDAVDVGGKRSDAEVARGGTLELEPGRGAELSGDDIALVAPCREHALRRKRARDAIERVRACGGR